MVDVNTLLQILWTSLATATYGVLLAAAFSLVLKVVKVWNFAQAGMMGIAYYTMYVVIYKMGWPALIGVAISLAVTITAALAMEVYGLQTFRRRNSPSLTYFIFTLVVSEFVQYLLSMIFGTEPVSLAAALMSPSTMVGGIVISRWDISALCTAVAVMGALYVLLKKTRQGKFMVAVADNPHLSRLYGINVRRIYALTFVVASVLVVAGMYLFGTRVHGSQYAAGDDVVRRDCRAAGRHGQRVWRRRSRPLPGAVAIVQHPRHSLRVARTHPVRAAVHHHPVFPERREITPKNSGQACGGHDHCRRLRHRPTKATGNSMEYVISLLVLIGLYVVLSSSFNLIIGFGGLVSIAHPIFLPWGPTPSAR
ncbi:branched-chain amino acid ABC transporter permease [Polaromonas sp. P1-6]|nr:branched-chain amino acid ABC transporter permease [Polaromonas sp. P1-6]